MLGVRGVCRSKNVAGVLRQDQVHFTLGIMGGFGSNITASAALVIWEIAAEIRRQLLMCDTTLSGHRLGDLARLPFGAIDFDAGELRFRTAKTGRLMAIPLPAPLRKHLETLPWPKDLATPLHPRAFAIIDAQGRSGTLSREFGELLAQAGLRPAGHQTTDFSN
jgi:hypothetical protein